MLQPKKTKFRKQQKGRLKVNTKRGAEIAFGSFGIKSLETAFITARQLEAARQAVTRYMKREGQIWIRVVPTSPLPRSLTKYVWVKVKVRPNILWPVSIRDVFCSKPTVCPWM